MDALRNFLEDVKRQHFAQGNFLGLLYLLIGRKVFRADGTVISNGLTWRELSNWLKKLRWDTNQLKELGLNPDDIPSRDRQRYWYTVISRAGVDTEAARQAGDKLALELKKHGYKVE
jgi:hypothetical protein